MSDGTDRVAMGPRPPVRREPRYNVSLLPGDFGLLLSHDPRGTAAGAARELCFEKFHARKEPCDGCPARRLEEIGDTSASVQFDASHGSGYVVVAATKLSPSEAALTVYRTTRSDLQSIVQARIEFLASSARLSKRETEVLVALLLTGHSLGDIASDLQITLGTLKFHVRNTLNKLGADSRVDLLRVLF